LKQDRRLAAWITETGIEKLEFNTDYLALLGLDPKVAPGNIYFFHMCVFYPLPGRKFFDGPLQHIESQIGFGNVLRRPIPRKAVSQPWSSRGAGYSAPG